MNTVGTSNMIDFEHQLQQSPSIIRLGIERSSTLKTLLRSPFVALPSSNYTVFKKYSTKRIWSSRALSLVLHKFKIFNHTKCIIYAHPTHRTLQTNHSNILGKTSLIQCSFKGHKIHKNSIPHLQNFFFPLFNIIAE